MAKNVDFRTDELGFNLLELRLRRASASPRYSWPLRAIGLDLGDVNRRMVPENDVIFGSVNANRAHYEAGATALARADRAWLSRLVSRRVPLNDLRQAFVRRPDDVKVVLDFDLVS